MSGILSQLLSFLRDAFSGSIDTTRDRAAWQGASAVEQATFGRVFNFISGALALVMIFGCVFISNATQNSTVLMYICGALWILPFVVVGGLLARFRQSLFVRLRGVINRFLGGG